MRAPLARTARSSHVPDTLPLNTVQAFPLVWESLYLGASPGIGVCLITMWTNMANWINQPLVEDRWELVPAQLIFWTLWWPEFWYFVTFQTCRWDWTQLPTPGFSLNGFPSHPQIKCWSSHSGWGDWVWKDWHTQRDKAEAMGLSFQAVVQLGLRWSVLGNQPHSVWVHFAVGSEALHFAPCFPAIDELSCPF